jgi:hypothetical protein
LARGALIALAAGAKFVPAALGPALAAGRGDRRLREILLFGVGFAGMLALTVLPFLPDAGVRSGFDQTVGFQTSRSSPFSIWGQNPSLEWLQTAVKLGAVALAVLVGFAPRHRSWTQVAALGAAVLVAVQLAADHWFYTYVAWFLPLLLVALFAPFPRSFSAAVTETAPSAPSASATRSSRPWPQPPRRGPQST